MFEQRNKDVEWETWSGLFANGFSCQAVGNGIWAGFAFLIGTIALQIAFSLQTAGKGLPPFKDAAHQDIMCQVSHFCCLPGSTA